MHDRAATGKPPATPGNKPHAAHPRRAFASFGSAPQHQTYILRFAARFALALRHFSRRLLLGRVLAGIPTGIIRHLALLLHTGTFSHGGREWLLGVRLRRTCAASQVH